MDRIEKALANHKKGYNCSQAVACSFSDRLGLSEADLFRLMEGFGLGGGDMCGTCGAVAGAAAVVGMLTSTGNLDSPDSKKTTYQNMKALNAKFREKNGATICMDLKGVQTGKMLRSCDGCIEDAARLVCEFIGEEA